MGTHERYLKRFFLTIKSILHLYSVGGAWKHFIALNRCTGIKWKHFNCQWTVIWGWTDSLLLNMLKSHSKGSQWCWVQKRKKNQAVTNKGEIQEISSTRCKVHIVEFTLMSLTGKYVVSLVQIFPFAHSGYPPVWPLLQQILSGNFQLVQW